MLNERPVNREYSDGKPVAESLKGLPAAKAKEFDAKGYPATATIKRSLASAEKHGHVWPVKYKLN
jgi:hypothetical protein